MTSLTTSSCRAAQAAPAGMAFSALIRILVLWRTGSEYADVFCRGVEDLGQAAVGAVKGDHQDAGLTVGYGGGFNRQEGIGVASGAPGLLSPWLVRITGNVRARDCGHCAGQTTAW